ncbi:ATP-binding protein [Umezawaea tangerina]|uniref:NB-ARC domain-containing protein n=1 Tax=Umezawaea tangerina TaxID=84725 RepID=A0A2T0S787_9PSEU|nr:tetratricopeptide repeat protein [Umezawaea tangerina]PRY29173.1 NB-ARC domain-containing protein [Umezawaea tangerina]
MTGEADPTRNVVSGHTGHVVQAGVVSGDVNVNLPRPVHVLPHQLPATVAPFVGRKAELELLDAALDDEAAPVQVISATAGAGKTTLAVHWAHRAAHRFPDGQLYVNLRGFDPTGPPVVPGEAIRGFLDAFGVQADNIPVALDAQAALYRSLLAERRVLVVLDNARDADQVGLLLPGSASSRVLVTSRDRMHDLIVMQGARTIALRPMSDGDAIRLIASRIGEERVVNSGVAVRELIDTCVRLPLALVLVAARATLDPDLPLEALAEEVRDEEHRLDALELGDNRTGIRAVFSWSCNALSPQATAMFRLLGPHAGPTFGSGAAAALTGVPVKRAKQLLAELTKAHLLEESDRRYSFHDLLRSYAAELATAVETGPDNRIAAGRMLDHYLHTALAADRLIAPQRAPIAVPEPPDGIQVVAVDDEQQAFRWFTTEHATLLAAVEVAGRYGLHSHLWQLAWSMTTYLERKGHWRDWLSTQTAAASAAEESGEKAAEARARRLASRAAIRLGMPDVAAVHLERALALYEELGSAIGKARTHIVFSWVRELQERYSDAVDHAAESLDLFRQVGNRPGEARALDQLGWELALAEQHEEGLGYCEAALELFTELGHLAGLADTEDSLGYINFRLGRYEVAVEHLVRAIGLCRELGDQHTAAISWDRLGDVCLALGDVRGALDAWGAAIGVLEKRSAPEVVAVRAKRDGVVLSGG